MKKLPDNLKTTLEYFNIKEQLIDINKIINIYLYGSHNYGTDNEKSDIDYIAVYNQKEDISDIITINYPIKMNITLYSPNYFFNKIEQHSIDVLECIFLIDNFKFENIKFNNFNLNKDTLRRSISAICSNSYVKAKKKILQGDDYIGKKSLFHSLRIADYGIQLSKTERLLGYKYPFSESLNKYDNFKKLFDEIMSYNTWEELNNKYKQIFNNIRTEFRKYTPLK